MALVVIFNQQFQWNIFLYKGLSLPGYCFMNFWLIFFKPPLNLFVLALSQELFPVIAQVVTTESLGIRDSVLVVYFLQKNVDSSL